MRSTNEILNEAASGSMPSHEECYYAMLALHARMDFWRRSLMDIGNAFQEGRPDVLKLKISMHGNPKQVQKEYAGFLQHDPKDWLGPMHDPQSEEGKQFYAFAAKLAEKAKRVEDYKQDRLSQPGDFRQG